MKAKYKRGSNQETIVVIAIIIQMLLPVNTVAHWQLFTSVYITLFCQYVPSKQLLICLLDLRLFSFIISLLYC